MWERRNEKESDWTPFQFPDNQCFFALNLFLYLIIETALKNE